MSRQIVAGVAGAGVFGSYHAAKYAALPGVCVSAVYDTDFERAEALAARYGAEPFADFDRFSAAVEAATVAAPASMHFDIARRLLERGRHVLVEKPIALRVDHADHLVSLARRKCCVLQVGHQERFVARALGLLSTGTPPREIHCVRANPPTGRGEDVSVVFDLMIHDLDLLRAIGLGELKEIRVAGNEDSVNAVMISRDTRARLEASRLASERDRRMRMIYEDGEISIDFVKRTLVNTTSLRIENPFEGGEFDAQLSDPLGYGVRRFVDAVRDGSQPAITGEEARAALEWAVDIEAAMRRQHTGRVLAAAGANA